MKNIFFLTRTYYPVNSGGVITRAKKIDLLKKAGFNTIVVTPNYWNNILCDSTELIHIPYNSKIYLRKVHALLEHIGIFDDYLDPWLKKAYDYLSKKVSPHDFLFATTGGELGMIKLASLLKDKLNCKFIANFHDPINFTTVNGNTIKHFFPHVKRDNLEKKYLENADLVITSCLTNYVSLKTKFPNLNIINSYHGYTKDVMIPTNKKFHKPLKILYGGVFGYEQSPEILAEVVSKSDNAIAFFIGNYNNYKPILKYRSNNKITLISYMEHSVFMKFAMDEVDLGFFSLSNDYLGACLPSKFFEYLNLGLPMLAALPYGNAMDLVNDNLFGKAVYYKNKEELVSYIDKLDIEKLNLIRSNIINNKQKWSFDKEFSNVINSINNL